MGKKDNDIVIHSTYEEINEILKRSYSARGIYTAHFNQNEEFFLKLPVPFIVSSFPVHHSIELPFPEKEYTEMLVKVLQQIVPQIPTVFHRLTYFFNPSDIFHPSFFQIFKFKEQLYLYLMKIDLNFRPNDGEIVAQGSNDTTNNYKTQNLFIEGDLIPLKGAKTEQDKKRRFIIEENISQTWIGERGRGYYIEGIWIDTELTKFFSRLFIPKGKTLYPYYPFTCKYNTFCHTPIDLSLKGRKQHLLYLYGARKIILPSLDKIQKSLQKTSFNPDMAEFINLKAAVPSFWNDVWESITVKPYLNTHDMKEYIIEF